MGRRLFPNVYEGWVVVTSAALIMLAMSAAFFYGFGTIFKEVIDEFGWSVAATSLAFSLRSEVGGIAAPLVGVMLDRVGPRRVMIGGLLVSALGIIIMSLIQELWHFYAAMLVIAVGSSAAGGQVGLVAVASWFEQRRASAMSFMTIGGGLGGLLVIVIAWLVEWLGWRSALQVLGVFMATGGVFFALNIRARPVDHPQPMDGLKYADDEIVPAPLVRWGIPVRAVLKSHPFLLLAVGMSLYAFGSTTFVVHQIPYLEKDLDVSKAAASTTVAVFTVFSIVGRLGFGIIADRFSKASVLAVSTAMVVLGLVVLAMANSFFVAMVAILIIAPGFGGAIPVRPAMLADYFGTKYFGTINGLGALIMTTGGAIGPWFVGWAVDRTGNYELGWYVSAAVTAAAIPLFLMAKPPDALVVAARAEAEAERAAGGLGATADAPMAGGH
ncbi:MAG: MFS transporter [Chloroflexi bacterium]|nr:MFS transporter [Chloroflexota bacterium]